MTAIVDSISSWRRLLRMGAFLPMTRSRPAPSHDFLLSRRVEEHAVARPAFYLAALDLLLLGIPDLDPHLGARLGIGDRDLGKGDVLLQERRPHGRGGEPQLLGPFLVGIEEGARGGLATFDLDAG